MHRSNNVEIMLARTFAGVSLQRLRTAIFELDETVIHADKVRALISMLPTKEEDELIVSYVNGEDGSLDSLCNSERFFYEISSIPNLHDRLVALEFKQGAVCVCACVCVGCAL